MSQSSARIVVTDWTFSDLGVEQAIAAQAGIELVGRQCRSESELVELCGEADAVIAQFAKVGAPVIRSMQRARVIVRSGIGVDNVDLEAARAKGIPVCNVPDYCVDEVADHALAFILAMTRQVVSHANHLRSGQWGLATPLTSMAALKQLTVGVIGFGRIGREVVRRLVAFKARVLVFDPMMGPDEIAAAGATASASLEAMLPLCDVVTPHCPSTAGTRKMFNREAFARMRPGALFVNVGRGDLADSAALEEALRSGHLGGAALDVFDPEPIPVDHPILRMPNVIVAPHIASASVPAVKKLRETAVGLAVRAVRGEPLSNVVNGVAEGGKAGEP